MLFLQIKRNDWQWSCATRHVSSWLGDSLVPFIGDELMGILFIMVVKVAQIKKKNKKYREDHCYASKLIFCD